MSPERIIRTMAGTLVLIASALAVLHSQWWLLLAAFVGVNLVIAGLFNACAAIWMLGKIGIGSGACPLKEAKPN